MPKFDGSLIYAPFLLAADCFLLGPEEPSPFQTPCLHHPPPLPPRHRFRTALPPGRPIRVHPIQAQLLQPHHFWSSTSCKCQDVYGKGGGGGVAFGGPSSGAGGTLNLPNQGRAGVAPPWETVSCQSMCEARPLTLWSSVSVWPYRNRAYRNKTTGWHFAAAALVHPQGAQGQSAFYE